MRPRRSLALSAIALVALALFVHKVSLALGNPFFGGDAGHRVQFAWAPVAPLASRIWLPFLQLHIFAVYHAHLPVAALTLIPCFYFFLAVLCLGLVSWRFTGSTRGGLVFTLLLMGGFAYQEVVPSASVQLYQEILGSFFFFFLLHAGALELRKSKILLVAVWAALITRETFWIYLFVVTALHAKRILADRALRLAFLSFWTVPVRLAPVDSALLPRAPRPASRVSHGVASHHQQGGRPRRIQPRVLGGASPGLAGGQPRSGPGAGLGAGTGSPVARGAVARPNGCANAMRASTHPP